MLVYLVNSLPAWVYWHHWRKELKTYEQPLVVMVKLPGERTGSWRCWTTPSSSLCAHIQSSWDPQSQSQTPTNVGLRGRRVFILWKQLVPHCPRPSSEQRRSGCSDAQWPPGGAVTPPTPGPAPRGALVEPRANPSWKSFLSSDVPSHYSSKGNEKGKLNELSSPPPSPSDLSLVSICNTLFLQQAQTTTKTHREKQNMIFSLFFSL